MKGKAFKNLVGIVAGLSMAAHGISTVVAAPSPSAQRCEPTATYTEQVEPTDTDTPVPPTATFTDTVEPPTATFTDTVEPPTATDTLEATLTPTEEEWEKSSLEAQGACGINCEVVSGTVCNTGDGDMTGSSSWELWYTDGSGAPKNGNKLTQGSFGPLDTGDCQTINYSPVVSGRKYQFGFHQEAGHPGAGMTWTEQCSAICEVTPTYTSTPDTPTATYTNTPETPTLTNTPEISLTPSNTPRISLTPSLTATLTDTPIPTNTPKKQPSKTPVDDGGGYMGGAGIDLGLVAATGETLLGIIVSGVSISNLYKKRELYN